MSLTSTAIESIKRAAKSDQAKDFAKKSGLAVAGVLGKHGSKAGGDAIKQRRQGKSDRALAIDLARQVGGTYSEGTILDGQRHYIVWQDEEPIDAFPRPADRDLANRRELQNFKGQRLTPPPPPEPRARRIPKPSRSSTSRRNSTS